mmetsp:Transcript_28426/g.53151  ORF Transcript_28426/g.53151 Transcript_28426/m.53151 type:complete len:331 (-) Transcript_28426:2499-3491(-)
MYVLLGPAFGLGARIRLNFGQRTGRACPENHATIARNVPFDHRQAAHSPHIFHGEIRIAQRVRHMQTTKALHLDEVPRVGHLNIDHPIRLDPRLDFADGGYRIDQMLEHMERGHGISGCVHAVVLPAGVLHVETFGVAGKFGIAFARFKPLSNVTTSVAGSDKLARATAKVDDRRAGRQEWRQLREPRRGFLFALFDVLFGRLDRLLIIGAIEVAVIGREIFFGREGVLADQAAFGTGNVRDLFQTAIRFRHEAVIRGATGRTLLFAAANRIGGKRQVRRKCSQIGHVRPPSKKPRTLARGLCRYYSLVALCTSMLTPGPMVELSDTFFM